MPEMLPNKMGRRTIEDIKVVDVEKRYFPSKHYVYVCHVRWSDGSTNVIYRRYSRLFDFQSMLLEMFPEEAGALAPSKRIIPFLPGKKFFGRSHIREVAIKRLGPIAEYCKAVVKLPKRISKCKEVLNFFQVEPDDIYPPRGKKDLMKANKISVPKPLDVYVVTSEYKKQETGEISLQVGMLVEVVEKTDTGWWFVNSEDEQGWVPGTFLQRKDGTKEEMKMRLHPGNEEQYLCTEEFKAQIDSELSMERGAVVDVIEKSLDGWWFVRYNDQEGYVPATYLIKTDNIKVRKHISQKQKSSVDESRLSCQSLSTTGPQIVRNLSEISDLLQEPSTSTINSKYNVDDDMGYDKALDIDDPEDVFSIAEVSKILKENNQHSLETDQVNENIQSMKSSLKRHRSIHLPPKPSVKDNNINGTQACQSSSIEHIKSRNKAYVTIAAFTDTVGDGISFEAGQTVQVLEKSESGWWYIVIENSEGWAPASYIQTTDMCSAASEKWAPSTVSVKTSGFDRNPDSTQEMVGDFVKPKSITTEKLNLTEKPNVTQKPNIPKKHNIPEKPNIPEKHNITEKHNVTAKIKGDTMKFALLTNQSTPAENRKSFTDELSFTKPSVRPTQPPPPPPPDNTQDINIHQASCVKVAIIANQSLKPQIPIKSSKVNISSTPEMSKIPENRKYNTSKVITKAVDLAQSKVVTEAIDLAQSKVVAEAVDLGKPNNIDTNSKSEIKKVLDNEVVPTNITKNLKSMFEMKDQRHAGVKIQSSYPALAAKSKNTITLDTNVLSGKSIQMNKSPISSAWVKQAGELKKLIPQEKSTVPENSAGTKVSELSKVLQAKFRNQTVEGSCSSNMNYHNNSDVKVWLDRQSSEPVHLVTPPTKRAERNVPRGRLSSHTSQDSIKSLDPNKYVSRPLPPDPKLTVSNIDKQQDSKQLQVKPMKPQPRPKITNPITESKVKDNKREGAGLGRPLQESGSANNLKCKFGRLGIGVNVNAVNSKKNRDQLSKVEKVVPVTTEEQKSCKKSTSHNALNVQKISPDIKNNKAQFDTKLNNNNLFCAVADFVGVNDGEITLVSGQQYELLDTAEGWWYVSSGEAAGWAPANYLTNTESTINLGSLQLENSISKIHLKIPVTGSNSQLTQFRACANFVAENEGELNLCENDQVVVLDQLEGGWWFVQARGSEGWVPASYLKDV